MKALRFTLLPQAASAAPTHRVYGQAFMQHDWRSQIASTYAGDIAEALRVLSAEAATFGLSPALIAAERERVITKHQPEAVAS